MYVGRLVIIPTHNFPAPGRVEDLVAHGLRDEEVGVDVGQDLVGRAHEAIDVGVAQLRHALQRGEDALHVRLIPVRRGERARERRRLKRKSNYGD